MCNWTKISHSNIKLNPSFSNWIRINRECSERILSFCWNVHQLPQLILKISNDSSENSSTRIQSRSSYSNSVDNNIPLTTESPCSVHIYVIGDLCLSCLLFSFLFIRQDNEMLNSEYYFSIWRQFDSWRRKWCVYWIFIIELLVFKVADKFTTSGKRFPLSHTTHNNCQ